MKHLIKSIADFFTFCYVLLDESRRQNLDGEWDKYHARKNRRSMRKEVTK